MIYTTEHIRSVNLGMDGQSEWLLCTLSRGKSGGHHISLYVEKYEEEKS